MCLAIPSKIVQIEDLRAIIDVCGARRDINLMLLPEEVSVGDYVLVHAGFAIQKVEKESAHEALSIIRGLLEEAGHETDLGDNDHPFG
jgi:hydrogenase expression/formation protein HypC